MSKWCKGGALTLLLWSGVGCSTAPAAKPDLDYFPLTIGARWTYACTLSGAPQPDRKVAIIGKRVENGTTYYQQQVTEGENVRSRWLFAVGEDVLLKYKLPSERHFPAGRKTLRTGDTFDGMTVVAERDPRRFAPYAPQFRAESGTDGETNPAWKAKWYQAGIGLVGEATGVEGECRLKSFSKGKAR